MSEYFSLQAYKFNNYPQEITDKKREPLQISRNIKKERKFSLVTDFV